MSCKRVVVAVCFLCVHFAGASFALENVRAHSRQKRAPEPYQLDHLQARLPRDVIATHYDIHVSAQELPKEKFKGQVKMHLTCNRKASRIFFHAHPEMNLTSVRIEAPHRTGVNLNQLNVSRIDDIVSVHLGGSLESGSRYILHVNYAMKIFWEYESGFFQESGEKSEFWVTFFEPDGARNAFPCMDEPDLKATFTVRILRPASLTAVSNTPLHTSIRKSHGMFLDTFQKTPVMSTYLVSWALTKYRKTTQGRVTVWDDRSYSLEKVKKALDIVYRSLDYFEKFIGIKYELPKLDIFPVSGLKYGGMENWGLIIVKPDFLFPPDAATIMHEIVHQWFGNLMTMTWWNDIWVQEAPAYYFGFLGAQALEPKKNHMLNLVQHTFADNHFEDTRPVLFKESDPTYGEQVNEDLSEALEYSYKQTRPYYLFRMIHFLLGHEEFKSTVTAVVTKYAKKSLNGYEFLEALTKEQRTHPVVNISERMRSWYESDGIPELHFKRIYTDDTIRIQQKPHRSNKRHVYHIPLVYNNNRAENISQPLRYNNITWLTTEQATIKDVKDSETAVLVNPGMDAYCAINYDDRNWALVGKYLSANPQMADIFLLRQLYYSAHFFYERKQTSVESTLWMWDAFSAVGDMDVWDAIAFHFPRLDEYYIGFNDNNQYNERVRHIWNRTAHALDFSSFVIDEYQFGISNHMKKILCTADFAPCVRTLLNLWRSTGSKFNSITEFLRWALSKKIDPESILAVAVRHGAQTAVKKIESWMKCTNSSARDLATAAHALMYSNDESVVKRATRYALSHNLPWDGEEAINRYTYRTRRIILNVFFKFMSKEPWSKKISLTETPWHIAKYMTTDEEIQKYKMLLEKRFPKEAALVSHLVETAKEALRRRRRDESGFMRWLCRQLPPLK